MIIQREQQVILVSTRMQMSLKLRVWGLPRKGPLCPRSTEMKMQAFFPRETPT